MTVSSTTNQNQYTGAGTTGPFPYTFRIFAATDLLVQTTDLSGNQLTLSYPAAYTVSGVGAFAGGNVTLVTALTAGWTLTVRRVRPLLQGTNLRNQGPYFPETVENALDSLLMIDQQQQSDIDRSFKAPVGSGVSATIASFLAGYYLRVNLAGTGVEGVTQVVASQAFLQSGAGAVSRTANSKMGESFSVKDFGAHCDGVTDDTSAIAVAIAAAAAAASASGSGVTVDFPAGLTIGIAHVLNSGVTLRGQGSGVTTLRQPSTVGTAKNVVELNDIDNPYSAPAINHCGVIGMTLDGNRAHVPNPASDVVNHGCAVTNVQNFVAHDVECINCYASGLGIFITADYFRVTNLKTKNCGSAATGMGGFTVNSSSNGVVTNHVSESDYWGTIYEDNCFGNVYQGVAYRPTVSGLVLNNQTVNYSVGNVMKMVVHESGVGAAGVNVQGSWRGNIIEAVVAYAGCTRTGVNSWTVNGGAYGLQVGSYQSADATKPQANQIKVVAYRCGSSGVLLQANYTALEAVIVECSQVGQGLVYGIECNGSWNQITAVFNDKTVASGLWLQRGIAVRAAAGEVGTAATENTIIGVLGSQQNPLDDTGTGTAMLAVVSQVSGAGKRIRYGAAAPVAGPWNVGDVTFNTAPASGGTIGWVCTTGGTPGTWKTWGTIA